MITKILPVILVFLLLGCNHQEDTTDTTNQDILDVLYSGTRTPAGFYTEDIPNDTFYTKRHIRDVNGSEVSAASFEEALNLDSLSSGEYISTSETQWYYQFSHVGATSFVNIYRVFKDSIINRTNTTLNCDNCYQGKVNPQINVKQLIEYMWQFTLDNNRNNAVLSSTITSEGDMHVLKMKTAKLQTNEDCDTITVYLVTYTVDKATGIILKSTNQIDTFENCLN